jgi:hypothetical protein
MLLMLLFLSLLFHFIFGSEIEEMSDLGTSIFLTVGVLYGNTEIFVLMQSTQLR